MHVNLKSGCHKHIISKYQVIFLVWVGLTSVLVASHSCYMIVYILNCFCNSAMTILLFYVVFLESLWIHQDLSS